jgi:hypothetical protein
MECKFYVSEYINYKENRMNELQKLNYVSYKVILLNTGYFPFGSWWTARY